MARKKQDFLDRYADLERRVRSLERKPSAYLETIIVAGEFDASTDIPPFFTPFGGAIVAVMGRTLSGNADVDIKKNGATFSTLVIASGGTVEHEEIDPPLYLNESDQVQIDITGSDAPSFGLSIGVIISP